MKNLSPHMAIKTQRPTPADQNLSQIPPSMNARCNYCNIPLPLSRLRRQEGMVNSWLSRQKPVLSCCPGCKKSLPRCSICHIQLKCLNPYPELKRERDNNNKISNNNSSSLADLANLPFAEWFTWCVKCKHGGHAHHLARWFETRDVCPVSQCDCRCWEGGLNTLRPRQRDTSDG